MKHLILVLFFVLGLVNVNSLSQENIVIGVYTQNYHYGDHKSTTDGRILTYLAPTYANIGWMAGAKVVPIYSYVSKQQVLSQLSKVNGVIFTGGQEYININNTWTANAHVIMEYAKKQNDAGRTFPVLGICQGLQLMLYLTSDMRADFLDAIQDQNGVWNTIQLTTQKYYLIDGVSDRGMAAITDPAKTKEGGPLYFYHSNGTLLSTFQRDTDLNQFWNVMGTTSKGNQTFVTYLQAKNYPFYVTQFHPERLSYSSELSDQLFQTRIELVNIIALNFAKQCKKSVHRYLKDELTNNIIDNYPMYTSTRFSDYKVYLFEEVTVQDGNHNMHQQGLSGAGDIIGFILVVGLIFGIVYYLYSRRKSEQQTRETQALAREIQRGQLSN